MTTAVAASSLGVAGTLIGAAVGSVISTMATTVYANSLSRAARVSRTLVVQRAIVPEHPAGTPTAVSGIEGEQGEKVVEYTTRSHTGPPEAVGAAAPLWTRIRWKPLAVAAGLVFLAALAVISVSETILGHPLSTSGASGTTLSNLGGSSSSGTQTPSSPTTPATGSPTATPTPSIAATAPNGVGAVPSPSASGVTTTATSGTQTSQPPVTTAPGGGATTSSSSAAAPQPSVTP